MSKKITGRVSTSTRRKLEALAADKFEGGIGKATIHVIRLGLTKPDQKNTMNAGENETCSVNIEEELVISIQAFQVAKGIAKRTDAAKRLIETGLSVLEAKA